MMKSWLLRTLVCLCMLSVMSGAAQADEIYVETPLTDATRAQRANIELAAMSIDGTRLDFGEQFSFNRLVGERSEERGFVTAENGRGVRVTGGGVAQVATTLYLALMQRDDIEYSSIYTYNESFTGSYVDSGYDAIATDYANGLDFAFNSYCEDALTIYLWLEEDALCCYLSGEEADYTPRMEGCDSFAITSLSDDPAQRMNIELAALSIDGWWMTPEETFSFNELVGARTEEFGYCRAKNGRGAEVIGGGVAQVAATVHLAVSQMENVRVTEMSSYGERFSGDYVEDPEDAVLVDYKGDIDYAFEYLGADELTIYVYIDEDRLICEVYED